MMLSVHHGQQQQTKQQVILHKIESLLALYITYIGLIYIAL